MNYKEKYEQALEKLQEALAPTKDGCKISGLTRNCLEEIFPELAESEDEKIRKDCIKYLDREYQHCPLNEDKMKIEKCIAWLEKQGKMLDADNVIEWLKPYGCVVDIIVEQFKRDFGL